MKLADFLIAEEGNDSKPLPDGRFASTYDKLGRCWNIAAGITKGVGPNTIWTQAQIDAAEASEFADVEACVARCVKVPIANNQRVACESLAYNVGDSGFEHSTVLRDINAGKMAEAAQAFLMWDKCHGEVVPGLIKRRNDEIRLFNTVDEVPVPADLRAVKTAITATANPEATIMTTAGPAAATPAVVSPASAFGVLISPFANILTNVFNSVGSALLSGGGLGLLQQLMDPAHGPFAAVAAGSALVGALMTGASYYLSHTMVVGTNNVTIAALGNTTAAA